VSGWEPLIALLGLGLLVHVGMGTRTALALRRVGVPPSRAWPAGLLAWPLVRRAVARAADAPQSADAPDGSHLDVTGYPDDLDGAPGDPGA
jgi:hypothetical protein